MSVACVVGLRVGVYLSFLVVVVAGGDGVAFGVVGVRWRCLVC